MSYMKQNFVDGQVLTAAQMNHIEDGIAAAESAAGSAVGLTATEKANMLALFAAAKDTSAETLAAYNALSTAWGGSSGGTDTPNQPEEGEQSILTTTGYDVWYNQPDTVGYNLPLTPKVALTLKGLKFKIQSGAAATIEVTIYDTVDAKNLATVTAEVTANDLEDGTHSEYTEVDAAFDVALKAGRFYKIWVGTTDSSKVLRCPVITDNVVAENEYFSISRDDEADYHWSAKTLRFGGYVTVVV